MLPSAQSSPHSKPKSVLLKLAVWVTCHKAIWCISTPCTSSAKLAQKWAHYGKIFLPQVFTQATIYGCVGQTLFSYSHPTWSLLGSQVSWWIYASTLFICWQYGGLILYCFIATTTWTIYKWTGICWDRLALPRIRYSILQFDSPAVVIHYWNYQVFKLGFLMHALPHPDVIQMILPCGNVVPHDGSHEKDYNSFLGQLIFKLIWISLNRLQ